MTKDTVRVYSSARHEFSPRCAEDSFPRICTLPTSIRARIAGNYWRKRCLKFKAPPKQIVYDEGPEAARLLQFNHYDPIGERPDGGHVAGFVPTCWRKLEVKKTS